MILDAPASIAFSINSLTIDAGRSTTSPAAIKDEIFGSNIFIVTKALYHVSLDIALNPGWLENPNSTYSIIALYRFSIPISSESLK